MNVTLEQKGKFLQITCPVIPSPGYLNRVLGMDCFEEIHALLKTFGKDTMFAKEITESYSAIAHLDKTFKRCKKEGKKPLVIIPGDGSRALTAAMAVLMNKCFTLSIDPNLRRDIIDAWIAKFKIRDFAYYPKKWEDCIREIHYYHKILKRGNPNLEIIVMAVHAHIDLKKFLNAIPQWSICYSLACCNPESQLRAPDYTRVIQEGEDTRIFSPKRQYKIWTNTQLNQTDYQI